MEKAKKYLHLGYVRYGDINEHSLIKELRADSEFLVDSETLDQLTFQNRLGISKFCLFEYGKGDVSGISDALRHGCVPVVITDRPIQDLPLIAMLVGWNKGRGAGVEVEELKRVLYRTSGGDDRHEKVRGLGVTAGQHFLWNEQPQPCDDFYIVLYQLRMKRHRVRYTNREVA